MKVCSPVHARVRSFAAASALAALALTGCATAQTAVAQSPQGPQSLRTAAEESGFKRHTRHPELLEYLRALRAASPEMRLGYYGETFQGRELPYAVFSRPAVTQPFEAWASGKPVLVLAANVHGNERTLRESLLLLLRDLATPGTEVNGWLDDLVIVVVPTINPDGFEASERGIRGNSWGIDMNRDYVKLEQQSVTNYIRNVLHRWRPHLFVDGHNGGAYPYNLSYQCASNASADPSLTQVCDEEIFPLIDRRMLENGYESWYYARGTRTRWNTGGWQARIGRNYGGLVNSVAILFESPGSQPLETGVMAGVVGYKTVLEYVRDNAEKLMALVQDARQTTAAFGDGAWDEVVVRQDYAPEPYKVTYKIAEGEGKNRRVIEVQSDSLMKRPVPVLKRPRPWAYVLPRDAVAAVDLLRRHGITVEVLVDSTRLEVDAYTLADVSYERAYNHQAATVVEVGEVVTIERTLPQGTFIVPTDQALGRLAAYMLEPETDDNVIYWNTMDAWLPKAELAAQRTARAQNADGSTPVGETGPDVSVRADAEPPLIPIFKLMDRVPLPARLLD